MLLAGTDPEDYKRRFPPPLSLSLSLTHTHTHTHTHTGRAADSLANRNGKQDRLIITDYCDCRIHRERLERWEEEIRELRARDAANEQASALLHNAQLHLLHTVRD